MLQNGLTTETRTKQCRKGYKMDNDMAENIENQDFIDDDAGIATSEEQESFDSEENDDVSYIADGELDEEDDNESDDEEISDGESEPPVSADNGTTDIDKTKAFSKRLKEKTAELERNAQKEAQERVDAYIRKAYDGQIDPYTGEKVSVKNESDFKKWEESVRSRTYAEEHNVTEQEAKEIIADQDFIRKQRIEKQLTEMKEKNIAELQAKANEDVKTFSEKHPGVNVEKLMNNKAFMDYADGKLSNKPLAEIYDGFINLVGNAETAAIAKADAKKQRSTSTGGKQEASTLSPQQEKDRLEWNKKNPDCKISVKEFLELKKGF